MSVSLLSLILQPLRPPFETARRYSWHKFRKDILAGATVSVVEVPQSMAYALIAGVPPQFGLYTSIIQGVIGALLSSSEHMTTGPTNTQSLLIASAVTRLIRPDSPSGLYMELVFALTMLKGLIQLSFAAAQMGNMVRYVSKSVIIGLVAGAGVLILAGQLPSFLGIDITQEPRRLPGVIGYIQRAWPHLHEVNWRAVGIGMTCVALVVAVKSYSKLLPGSLLAVVVAAVCVKVFHLTDAVPLIPKLPWGFPHFQVPALNWNNAEALFGGALALALIGMLESVSIAKSLAAHTGEKISANQEFFAQGLKNFLSSFYQCIPGSGSFTRSALDYAAGAETRFAAVFNACFVAVIFWFLADAAYYIPLSALAAVLFVIGFGLIDWRYILRIVRSSRSDAIVCIITFLATLVVPLEYAIFIGIFLNIGLYLRIASRLHLQEMVQSPGGPFFERPLSDRRGEQQVLFIQAEGDLFFGVADELQDQLTHILRSPVRVVIFRLKRTHSIDATVLAVIEQFVTDLHARGGYLLLCGVKPELMTVIQNYGLMAKIGKENVFETGFGVFTSAKRAMERAKKLIGSSIDATGIDIEEPEAFSYQI